MFFDCVTVFKALYLRSSMKGGTETQFVVEWIVIAFNYTVCWSPTRKFSNRSSEICHLECSDTIKIHNKIIFYLRMELPHITTDNELVPLET